MKTILITGPDGSGKSTIFNELSKHCLNNTFELIYLPTIELKALENDTTLLKTATFVNNLSQTANEQKLPALKAVAIFSAMLLFKKIYGLKAKKPVETIFCERHPLIDTIVYAQFYAGKTDSSGLNNPVLEDIDNQYGEELEYLINLIPSAIANNKKSGIAWLAAFIFKCFFIEKKLKIEDLKELFEIELPDKIFYLKAKAEILYQRIAEREIHEAHETIDTLDKLGKSYDKLFSEIEIGNPALVEIIDANHFTNLNQFSKRILQKYT